MAKTGRLTKKTGLSLGPILMYVAAVVVIGGGLFAWDAAWRRRQEEAQKPPAPEVIVKNLVENIIGRDTVKSVKVDEPAGAVEVVFESATYPPAARATLTGEIAAQGLATVGQRVKKGDPVASAKSSDGAPVVSARAEYTGRVEQVLVKPGDKVEEGRAVVTIVPDDKKEARQNLETEGLLAWQAIISQLGTIKTVTSKISYKDLTLATVVGKRGERKVTTTYHDILK